jgi:hypothetical protein
MGSVVNVLKAIKALFGIADKAVELDDRVQKMKDAKDQAPAAPSS